MVSDEDESTIGHREATATLQLVGGSAAGGAVRAEGNAAGDRTRARLITAGERLFARYGLDAVSVRDITAAAKANTAAVHYHFGSKRGLIEAILEARAAEVGRRRGEFLDRIEAAPDPTLRDVVAALVIPTAELARDRDLRQKMIDHGQRLVDGRGAERAAAALEELSRKSDA